MKQQEDFEERTEQRLRRIETRLVQLMLHFGLDPYFKVYDAPGKLADPRRYYEQD
jgi:signal transduction histidine kinase